MVELLQPGRDTAIPPLPVCRTVAVLLARSRRDQRRILSASAKLLPETCKPAERTRSNAAIFRLLDRGSSSPFSSTYSATNSVAGSPSPGLRSLHDVWSLGFLDVGVKKLATADSAPLSASAAKQRRRGIGREPTGDGALCLALQRRGGHGIVRWSLLGCRKRHLWHR